jgi:hypothetical protein
MKDVQVVGLVMDGVILLVIIPIVNGTLVIVPTTQEQPLMVIGNREDHGEVIRSIVLRVVLIVGLVINTVTEPVRTSIVPLMVVIAMWNSSSMR